MAGDEQKIRVLIVDDVAETRENIRKLLQFESDLEVVGAANSGRSGIEAAKELRPDVVLMDINMPDMDGITATELIRQQNPATQIVILSVQGDPELHAPGYAGWRDVIFLPSHPPWMSLRLRCAGRVKWRTWSAPKRLLCLGWLASGMAMQAASGIFGKVIVVYGPKGGTGTTTIAVNLAVTLHSEETRVAIVDGNLQFGDVAVFMNEQVRNSILDLAPRADELDPEIVNNVMLNHAASGVRIAGSAKPARICRECIWRAIWESAKILTHYVFLYHRRCFFCSDRYCSGCNGCMRPGDPDYHSRNSGDQECTLIPRPGGCPGYKTEAGPICNEPVR